MSSVGVVSNIMSAVLMAPFVTIMSAIPLAMIQRSMVRANY